MRASGPPPPLRGTGCIFWGIFRRFFFGAFFSASGVQKNHTQKKFMSKMFYKKNENISMSFFTYFLLPFVGRFSAEFKNIKNNCRKKHQKPQKKTPTHLRGYESTPLATDTSMGNDFANWAHAAGPLELVGTWKNRL
jgi:hypothetical protein